MSDNVAVSAGVGTTISADELTIGGTSVKVQRNKLIAGPDSTYVGDVSGRLVDNDANASAMFTDPRPLAKRIAVTPTISTTPAYAVKDNIGGAMAFANATRATGGSLLVQSAQITDKDQRLMAMDLVLYTTSIVAPTDNNIFAPTDAENAASYAGHISFTAADYGDFSTNSVACRNVVGLEIVLTAGVSTLYGYLVCRSVATAYLATSSLTVTLTVLQD